MVLPRYVRRRLEVVELALLREESGWVVRPGGWLESDGFVVTSFAVDSACAVLGVGTMVGI